MAAGRKSLGKVRYTLTLDPKLEKEARKLDPNFSGFMEEAGWREVKRRKRSGHGRDMERGDA
jgi:hypothetical protein